MIDAAFFDIFGILAFIFIIIVSAMQLMSKKLLARWFYWVLLIIGLIGLIVDFSSVYFNFLK